MYAVHNARAKSRLFILLVFWSRISKSTKEIISMVSSTSKVGAEALIAKRNRHFPRGVFCVIIFPLVHQGLQKVGHNLVLYSKSITMDSLFIFKRMYILLLFPESSFGNLQSQYQIYTFHLQ